MASETVIEPEIFHCTACGKSQLHNATYKVVKDASGRVVNRLLQSKRCAACGLNS